MTEPVRWSRWRFDGAVRAIYLALAELEIGIGTLADFRMNQRVYRKIKKLFALAGGQITKRG